MRGRLKGAQRHKLRKLLYMKYRPSEIAEEVDIDVDWVYKIYIPLGCPHERDEDRHIWIVGTEFREWYLETYRKHKLAANEASCVSCKRPVIIVDPVEHHKDGLKYLLSKCPDCSKTVAKILNQKRRSQP
jgi:hypothetical protein